MDHKPQDMKYYIDRHFEKYFQGPIESPDLKGTARDELFGFWFLIFGVNVLICLFIGLPSYYFAIGAVHGVEYWCLALLSYAIAIFFGFLEYKLNYTVHIRKRIYPFSFEKTLAYYEALYEHYQQELKKFQ